MRHAPAGRNLPIESNDGVERLDELPDLPDFLDRRFGHRGIA